MDTTVSEAPRTPLFQMKGAVARRSLAALLLLVFGGCTGVEQRGGPSGDADFRPNIVWIVAEDLSPVIPPFGDSTVATPALSRLADEGIRYTRVFSTSGVCAPSRAALALGMYQNRIGAHHMRTGPWASGNVSEAAIAAAAQDMPQGVVPYEAMPPADARMHSEYLREAGYYAVNNAKHDYQFRAPATAWDESSPRAHWRGRAPGQPFFAIFNLEVTHESQIWQKAEDSLLVEADLHVPIPPYLPDTDVGRRDARRLYSNILEMDAQVGALLAELEEDGLLDSTIVFWYSDHGGPLPRQKRLLYDSGLHVPLIIRFPDGRGAGETDGRLISFVDFKPTVLSLAGIPTPDYVDGQAFLGAFAADQPRRYVHAAADRFDESYDMIRAVRDDRFKYLRNFRPDQGYYLPLSYREQMPIMQELLRMRDAGTLDPIQAQWFRSEKSEEELFDTASDPHELQNLAGNPEYADKLAELRAEATRWMQEIDDRGRLSEPEYIASIWPGGIQPVTRAPVASVESGRVRLTSGTPGASIGYKRLSAGATPDGGWKVYSGPITLSEGDSLVALAHRIGYRASEIVAPLDGGRAR